MPHLHGHQAFDQGEDSRPETGQLKLSPAAYQNLMDRMRRIEGQVRGLQRMLAEGAECDLILNQVAAVRGALSRIGVKLLGCHLGARVGYSVEFNGAPVPGAGA